MPHELTCGTSQIRVYNYNTSEKITSFEAHPDYIRAIVVHPTQPFVLTASDDMTIKLWDWEKGWKNVRVFEGNSRMWMAGTAHEWTIADGTPRLCHVPGDQSQGHEHFCLSLLGQDWYATFGSPNAGLTNPSSVKIWSLGSSTPNFQLEAHETKGVNHVDYYPHSDKPYLLTTSDDVRPRLLPHLPLYDDR